MLRDVIVKSRFVAGLLAIAGAMALVPHAHADLLPPGFEITVLVGESEWNATNNADLFSADWTDSGGTVFGTTPLMGQSWSMTGLAVAYTTNPSQTNAFTFTNISGVTQTFTVTVTTPGFISGPTIMFGSIAGGLTDHGLNGATFAAPAGSSVYTAMIDGSAVATLWDSPFSVSTGSPPYTASLGQDAFNFVPGPGVMMEISIVHHFTLTAGDSVTLNSAFVVIPGPGGLALLAGGFLFARRRRR